MKFLLSTHSHYPKIGGTAGEQRLRRAYHQMDRGLMDSSALVAVLQSVTEQVVRDEEAADTDIVTGGLMSWKDPLTRMVENLEGIEINGLLRFFDTNFYFRQPVIVGKIAALRPIFVDEARHLQGLTNRVVKVVMTGPYTLARLSKVQTRYYPDLESVVEAFADILSLELEYLSDIPIQHVQIEEPALVQNPQDLPLVRVALEELSRHRGASQLWLSTYFGDCSSLYDAFQSLPVQYLLMDMTYSPTLPQIIREKGTNRTLALGLIDGRNTKLDSMDKVLGVMDYLSPVLGKEAILTTSSGLEYLPREKAREKLQLLKRIRQAWNSEVTP